MSIRQKLFLRRPAGRGQIEVGEVEGGGDDAGDQGPGAWRHGALPGLGGHDGRGRLRAQAVAAPAVRIGDAQLQRGAGVVQPNLQRVDPAPASRKYSR